MNRFRYGEKRWVLRYGIPGIVLAGLVSLRALGVIDYTGSTLVTMTALGSTTLLLVAAVHYLVVYRGVTVTHD